MSIEEQLESVGARDARQCVHVARPPRWTPTIPVVRVMSASTCAGMRCASPGRRQRGVMPAAATREPSPRTSAPGTMTFPGRPERARRDREGNRLPLAMARQCFTPSSAPMRSSSSRTQVLVSHRESRSHSPGPGTARGFRWWENPRAAAQQRGVAFPIEQKSRRVRFCVNSNVLPEHECVGNRTPSRPMIAISSAAPGEPRRGKRAMPYLS